MVAELIYHNHISLEEIAGLDDMQLANVYFRRRDKYGTLLRDNEEIPQSNNDGLRRPVRPVSYKQMQLDVWRNRGYTEEEVQKKWQDRLKQEPSLMRHVMGGTWH